MRRKIAVCVLIAAVVILAGCVYGLVFGRNGFLNAQRQSGGRAEAGMDHFVGAGQGAEDGGSGKENGEGLWLSEDGQDLSAGASQGAAGGGSGRDAGEDSRAAEDSEGLQEQGDSKNSQNLQEGSFRKEDTGTELVFRRGSMDELGEAISQEVSDQIDGINAGGDLCEATGLEEAKGYFALTRTNVIIAQDKENGEEATGRGRLTLYVPNLVEGLTDVSALFYDCEEGCWRLIPAEVVDAEGKRISVTIEGSGVVTTVHWVG